MTFERDPGQSRRIASVDQTEAALGSRSKATSGSNPAAPTLNGTFVDIMDAASKASLRALFYIRFPTAATIAPSSGNLPVFSFE
jgi:hypothetical protein